MWPESSEVRLLKNNATEDYQNMTYLIQQYIAKIAQLSFAKVKDGLIFIIFKIHFWFVMIGYSESLKFQNTRLGKFSYMLVERFYVIQILLHINILLIILPHAEKTVFYTGAYNSRIQLKT